MNTATERESRHELWSCTVLHEAIKAAKSLQSNHSRSLHTTDGPSGSRSVAVAVGLRLATRPETHIPGCAGKILEQNTTSCSSCSDKVRSTVGILFPDNSKQKNKGCQNRGREQMILQIIWQVIGGSLTEPDSFSVPPRVESK